MNEQMIFLAFLILGLGATLGLYILKALKQVRYKGDERWQLIQLHANNTANITNWILIVLIAAIPVFADPYMTFSLQRVLIFGLIYIGLRNLAEFISVLYFDGKL